jgi:plastocyanin|tara:strand:- start:35873 stop:36358 length:486 start_codon:yes stop_codon:yes gene_type:complete
MNKILLGLLCAVVVVCSTSTAAAESSDVIVTVDSTSLRFSPSQVTITEGQAVRFMWDGQALAHNAVADDGMFDSGDPERDVDYRFVFEVGTAGTHTFVCEPHASAGMVGTITVDAAPVEVIEEEPEPPVENTPALSLVSSLLVMAFAATLVARNGKHEHKN